MMSLMMGKVIFYLNKRENIKVSLGKCRIKGKNGIRNIRKFPLDTLGIIR